MASLGRSRPNDKLVGPQGADQSTTSPDIQETAKRLMLHYTTTGKKVVNFPPYKAMKGANGDFVADTSRLGALVNRAYRVHRTEANQYLWDRFDDTLDHLSIARTGDHGHHVVTDANKELGDPNRMTIKTMPVGENPLMTLPGLPPSVPVYAWETVDWDATVKAAESDGITNAPKLISDWLDKFYSRRKPRQHIAVVNVYKEIAREVEACRGRRIGGS
ncbi:hypothetical protein BJX61DRAFT_540624 [Aspergillus egyptiacus]|nr:hypothetical protein BJX61DRAFT_540624 [Aspergillus egyptiacus]